MTSKLFWQLLLCKLGFHIWGPWEEIMIDNMTYEISYRTRARYCTVCPKRKIIY